VQGKSEIAVPEQGLEHTEPQVAQPGPGSHLAWPWPCPGMGLHALSAQVLALPRRLRPKGFPEEQVSPPNLERAWGSEAQGTGMLMPPADFFDVRIELHFRCRLAPGANIVFRYGG